MYDIEELGARVCQYLLTNVGLTDGCWFVRVLFGSLSQVRVLRTAPMPVFYDELRGGRGGSRTLMPEGRRV